MSADVTLYTNPFSRGQIARWMLEEAAVDYDAKIVNYGPEMKSDEYCKLNPQGKVPTLVHNGRVVTEVAAICAYVADAFPERELAPPANERHDYYRWLFYGAGPMEAAIVNNHMQFEVPPEKERMLGYGNFDTMIKTVVHAVSQGDYLCGDRFTAADVYVGAQIGWGLQFGTVPKQPEFEAYWARLAKREAYQKAKQIDDELGAELKAKMGG